MGRYLDALEELSLEYQIAGHAEYYQLLASNPGISAMFRGLLIQARNAQEFGVDDLKAKLSISYHREALTVLDGFGDLWLIRWDGRGGITARQTWQDLPKRLDSFGFRTMKDFFRKNPDVRCVPYVPVECRATAPAA